MAAPSRGNGTNFDWLRKSCDISTCDLSPDVNPEKNGRPMKSAINLPSLISDSLCAKTEVKAPCLLHMDSKDSDQSLLSASVVLFILYTAVHIF